MAVTHRITLPGLGWIEHPVKARGDVRIGDRLLPPEVQVTFPSDDEQPGLRMTLAVVDGVPQCRAIHIEAKEGARGVRTSDLRAVALEDWIEQLYATAAKRIIRQEHGYTTAAIEATTPARHREAERLIQRARAAGRRKITGEFLARVALTYRENIDSRRPTESVRQVFGVSHSAAAEYVYRARKAGYLPATTRGKAGA